MPNSTRLKRRFASKPIVCRRSAPILLTTPMVDRAGQLDRRADAELAAGRHLQAERLAHEAAALRGWA